MPKLVNSLPKLRHHKASGQAVVTFQGRDYYLGRWRSKAAQAEYNRLAAEYLAHGRIGEPNHAVTVSELLAAYVRFAVSYYRESNELEHVKLALRPLKELYSRTLASEFGPLALKTVRQRMIDARLTRTGINHRIGRIKRVFRWAVESQLIPADVYHGLQAVRGLTRGRSDAVESEPVKPIPEAFVDAIQTHVLPQVWAMVELQRLAGMRPGEVCTMRTCDIDTSGKVWVYTPQKHKNAHRGHERHVYLGPRAQAVLKPWLRTDLEAYLFQPKEAVEHLRLKRNQNRKTPLSCGNRIGTNRKLKPQKNPSELYSVQAYRKAVKAGCKAAEVPIWGPHRLRHNAATWLRKEFGLDVARVVLGHRSPAVTEIYAELDHEKAKQVMANVG